MANPFKEDKRRWKVNYKEHEKLKEQNKKFLKFIGSAIYSTAADVERARQFIEQNKKEIKNEKK